MENLVPNGMPRAGLPATAVIPETTRTDYLLGGVTDPYHGREVISNGALMAHRVRSGIRLRTLPG
jgi:hypothetical protein